MAADLLARVRAALNPWSEIRQLVDARSDTRWLSRSSTTSAYPADSTPTKVTGAAEFVRTNGAT